MVGPVVGGRHLLNLVTTGRPMYPILRKIPSASTDAMSFGRFLWGLGEFLGRRLTVDEATAILEQRMVDREANFLSTVRRGMFESPESGATIGSSVARIIGGACDVRLGSLFPALHRLEEAGSLEASWGERSSGRSSGRRATAAIMSGSSFDVRRGGTAPRGAPDVG